MTFSSKQRAHADGLAATQLAVTSSLDPLARLLVQLVDLGLLCVLFIAPLFMGGRHPVGTFVYVLIVSLTAMIWCLRQCLLERPTWHHSGGELILLIAVALLIFQLAPWPTATLLKLSPEIGRLLPAWTASAESAAPIGVWNRLSLAPQSTRASLVIFLAHATLFLLVVQRLRTLDDVERILRWIASAAVGMASLGLVQFLVGNGKFLWIYEYPFRDAAREVSGSFSNANHFAHFLALGIAPLIWWLHRSLNGSEFSDPSLRRGTAQRPATSGRRHRPPSSRRSPAAPLLIAVGIGIVLVAGFLSVSRGGFLAIFFAALICTGLFARRSLLSGKTLAVLAITGVVAVGALLVYGFELVADQLSTFSAGSLDELDHGAVRRKLWAANLTAATHFPLVGTGGGSQVDVYPTYYEHYSDFEYTHTENAYLQVFLEYGGVGLAMLLIGIVICGAWCARALRRSVDSRAFTCAAAATAAIAVSLFHSAWDFVWYIPACMSVAIIHLACLSRLCRLATSANARTEPIAAPSPRVPGATDLSPLAWAAITVTFLGLAVFMVKHESSGALASLHWDQYVRLAKMLDDEQLTDAEVELRIEGLMPHLERALYFDPHDARANLKMAALCLRRFEIEQNKSANPMPLAHIRDAVRASGFTTRQAQDEWLAVVLGENRQYLERASRHARRALWLCPLLGEAYMYAAELTFLDRLPATAAREYIAQALLVRPNHGMVLLAAGNFAAESGEFTLAIAYWKRSFNHDPRFQKEVVRRLAAQVPADFFLTQFNPNREGLSRLYREYQNLGRVDEAKSVGRHYVGVVEQFAASLSGPKAAAAWHEAHAVHYYLADYSGALRCARQAVEADANDPLLHRALASMLLELQQFDEAIEHLKWCVRRNPDDSALKHELDVAIQLHTKARVAQRRS